jgi:hypothetical protein
MNRTPQPESNDESSVGLEFLKYAAKTYLGNIADRMRLGIGVLSPDGDAVVGLKMIGFCPFCKCIRSTTPGRAACQKSDHAKIQYCERNYRTIDRIVDALPNANDAEQRMSLNLQLAKHIEHFRCPFGLVDLCYPIGFRGSIRGFLFFGQIRCEDINPDITYKLHKQFTQVFARNPDDAPRTYAKYTASYFSTPRRPIGSDDLLSLYLLLRDYAHMLSNMMDVCSLVDDGVSLCGIPTTPGKVQEVVRHLLGQNPLAPDLRGELYNMAGYYIAGAVAKGVNQHAADVVHSKPAAMPAPSNAPPWLRILLKNGKVRDPLTIDGAELKTLRRSGYLRGKGIIGPLHVNGRQIGALVVYPGNIQETAEERLKLWLRAICPVIAGLLWREGHRLFMDDLYRQTDLSPLAETVQRGIGEFIDLGRDGACTLFWAEERDAANWRRSARSLMPALPETVRAGCGPGARQGETWYAYGEGLTGWTWRYGAELVRSGTPLIFSGTSVEDGIEGFRKRLMGDAAGWPSWCEQPPRWAGKVNARGERDSECPRPTVVVPVVDGAEVLGVIRVTRSGSAFKDEDVGVLSSIANHLAVVKRMHLAIHKTEDQVALNQHVHNVVDPLSALVERCGQIGDDHDAFPPRVLEVMNQIRLLHTALAPTALWMKAVKAVGYVKDGMVLPMQLQKARAAIRTVNHHQKIELLRQMWLSPSEIRTQLETVRLTAVEVQLNDVVQRAVDRFINLRNTIGNKKVEVSFVPPSGTSVQIVCDSEILCQMVCETMENARKSMKDACGAVAPEQEILVECGKKSDGWVHIRVYDKGRPMNAAIIEQLAFLPVEPHRVRLCTKGVGLELNAVLAVIHGGFLTIDGAKRGFRKVVTLCLPTKRGE